MPLLLSPSRNYLIASAAFPRKYILLLALLLFTFEHRNRTAWPLRPIRVPHWLTSTRPLRSTAPSAVKACRSIRADAKAQTREWIVEPY